MKTKPLMKLTLMGKQSEKEVIINKLHHLGVLHVSELSPSDVLERDVPSKQTHVISDHLLKLRYLAEKTNVNITFTLDGLPDYSKVLKRSQDFIDSLVDDVKKLDSEKQKVKQDIKKYESHIHIIESIPAPFTTEKIHFSKQRLEADKVVVGKGGYYYFGEVEGKVRLIDTSFVKKDSESTLKESKEKLDELNKRLNEIDSRLFKKINGKQSTLRWLISSLENYYEQGVISQQFGKTELFFVVEGYIDPKHVDDVKSINTLSVVVEPISKGPTLLQNKGIIKHFEPLINMYGTPKYNSVDPTLIMAIFYPFFFGFMLSDIGYGLMMMVALAFIRYHYGTETKPILWIFGLSALSSIIFGLIFGSFFGNLVYVTPLYNDSFSASFEILQIALIIGLVHINIGILLALYQGHIQKEFVPTVLDVSHLYFLQLILVAAFIQQYWLIYVSIALAVIVLLVRKGLIGLTDITGFFGIWFSYARLLALSLATAGVALAINIIADKVAEFAVVGPLLWVLVLVLGHTFNFVLNMIACVIHSARLHYVEQFSLFFKEGGEAFKPFKIKTKIKE